jgi:hypothetical protein
MMRHFLLLSTPIAGLAISVIASPQQGALMASARPPPTLLERLLRAAAVAVDLVVLAGSTNQRHLAAAGTAEPP